MENQPHISGCCEECGGQMKEDFVHGETYCKECGLVDQEKIPVVEQEKTPAVEIVREIKYGEEIESSPTDLQQILV